MGAERGARVRRDALARLRLRRGGSTSGSSARVASSTRLGTTRATLRRASSSAGSRSSPTRRLAALRGTLDIVTAIEVLEHVVDPLAELAKIRSLLRRDGLLFLTTGNAAPHRDKLPAWGYVIPEIHVSLFEPRTLATALERSGFVPIYPGYAPGWDDIIRFKILKTLRIKSTNAVERMVPWPLVSRFVDWRLRPSAQPIGRAG